MGIDGGHEILWIAIGLGRIAVMRLSICSQASTLNKDTCLCYIQHQLIIDRE